MANASSKRDDVDQGPADEEATLRAAIDDWRRAIRAKDADAVLRHYARELVTFDLAPPLKTAGPRRDALQAWFDTWRGPIELQVTDLAIVVGGDLAYARSLNRIGGTKTNGTVTSIWVRATVCFRKAGRAWKVVHEHTSVPFYMDGSDKAAVDLKP